MSDALTSPCSMTALFNALPSGVVWLDGLGRVAKVNPAAQSMLGEPLLGEAWAKVIERVFAPQPDDGLQVSLKDGRRVQLAISHIDGEPGQLIQLTDLTPTRAWVEQQGHAQRLAALGQMAATLAHQIRTPLSAALLYGANLSSPKLNEQQRGHFQQRLVARLSDIERQISDVLLFARPDQAALAEPINLTDLLNDCVQASQSLLSTKDVTLQWQPPAQELSSVLGNESALRGIILNLIENAADAGASQVSVSLKQQAAELGIHIRDNGNGIADNVLQQIFTPFFTTRSQGTGLGLAAVRAVIKAHQGRVTVQSTLGQGSCFSLWLPEDSVEC